MSSRWDGSSGVGRGAGEKKGIAGLFQSARERKEQKRDEAAQNWNEKAAAAASEIIDVLKTINFENSRLPPTVLEKKSNPEQLYCDLEYYIKYMMQELKDDTQVFEVDVSPVDVQLLILAKNLKEAVEQGYENTAEASKSCLATGILKIRMKIPKSQAIDPKEFVRINANYLKECVNFVMIARSVDMGEENLPARRAELESYKTQQDQQRDELYRNLMENPDFREAFNNLRRYDKDRLKWSDSERQLHSRMVESALARTVYMLNQVLLSQKEDSLSMSRQQMQMQHAILIEVPEVKDPNEFEKWKESIDNLVSRMAQTDTELEQKLNFFTELEGRLVALEHLPGTLKADERVSKETEEILKALRKQQEREIEGPNGGGTTEKDLGLRTEEEIALLKEAQQNSLKFWEDALQSRQSDQQLMYERE